MAEDEAAEDCKVSSLDPSRGTSTKSDATDVMSWDIKSEIAHSLEIGRRLLWWRSKIAIQKKVMMFFWCLMMYLLLSHSRF